MKYKVRKKTKRKYKQAIRATVATLSLGITAVGGASSVFAADPNTQPVNRVFDGDGTYKLYDLMSGSRYTYLNVSSDENANLWSNDGSANQKWYFEYDENKDAYQIKSETNRNLVLAWNDFEGSKNVFATPNLHLDEHYWIVEHKNNGFYYIKNKKDSNLVLDAEISVPNDWSNFKINDGTNVRLRERDSSSLIRDAQLFRLQKSENKSVSNGYYNIGSSIPHGNKVLDVSSDGNVILWQLNDGIKDDTISGPHRGAVQQWYFEYDENKDAYQIKSQTNQDLVLAWDGSQESRNVFITPNQHTSEQYWIVTDSGGGNYIFKNKKDSNLVLDVDQDNPYNGTNIKVTEQHDLKDDHIRAQKFNLQLPSHIINEIIIDERNS
ncbi:RICIN domain-containing protein [Bacillus cereus]|uniref:RICIN domain-containing protein n=1 Tax=Bacillus cereus TaxID=1396 RepID=UPI000BF9E235|nr:RICIN domain-containing protein [Bacillus cereus]PFN13044.1 hypothetical protein COJ72_23955 [Bacillus cereus]